MIGVWTISMNQKNSTGSDESLTVYVMPVQAERFISFASTFPISFSQMVSVSKSKEDLLQAIESKWNQLDETTRKWILESYSVRIIK